VLTQERGDVPVHDLQAGEHLILQGSGFGRRILSERLALAIGIAVGDGCLSRQYIAGRETEYVILVMAADEAACLQKIAAEVNEQKQLLRAVGASGRGDPVHVSQSTRTTTRLSFGSRPVVNLFKEFAILDQGSAQKRFTPAVFDLDRASLAGVLRGLFTADGTVANYGEKSQYIALDSTSLTLLQQVQLLLLAFGIKAKLYRGRRGGVTAARLPDGRGNLRVYPVQEAHSLRVSRSSRFIFEREIGFDPASPKTRTLAAMNAQFGAYHDAMTDVVESVEPLGEEAVYDLTEPVTHHFVANGFVIHNCSEFVFLDDTAFEEQKYNSCDAIRGRTGFQDGQQGFGHLGSAVSFKNVINHHPPIRININKPGYA
jgi:ribonucleoside-diphosphate reductase alpha chain